MQDGNEDAVFRGKTQLEFPGQAGLKQQEAREYAAIVDLCCKLRLDRARRLQIISGAAERQFLRRGGQELLGRLRFA